jgi:hypothetical protein
MSRRGGRSHATRALSEKTDSSQTHAQAVLARREGRSRKST